MRLSSEQLALMLEIERASYGFPVRIQLSAGSGCTVYEVFDRDPRLLGKIPLVREIVGEGGL